MADPTAPPRRRRLTQKPAAFALGLGILAVPLIPVTANAVLPDRDWSADAEDVTPVELITDDGERIAVGAMDGWQIVDRGSSVIMVEDGTVVTIQAYDRMDRDPSAVAQRLMRANRLEGVSAALDGGVISGNGATLSGDTCVAVTTDTTGTCAFLYDDDVVVSVIALTDPASQGPDIETIAGLISREKQQ